MNISADFIKVLKTKDSCNTESQKDIYRRYQSLFIQHLLRNDRHITNAAFKYMVQETCL